MQSFRSKLVIWILKNRHLLKFRLKPEVVDENFSVVKFRNEIDITSKRMKTPKEVTIEKISINGMNAEWISPEQSSSDKALLYIHGGGFITGNCNSHRVHVAKFALQTKLKCLLFDYRLAPKHPFPAAVDDCVKAYQFLVEKGYEPQKIIIGGESAGATLTLSLLLSLKEQKLPLPKAAFSISPVVDLSCNADSFNYNAKNDIAPMNSWKIWTNMYIADNDIKNPLLSPIFGNYENIPPVFICVGTHEIHYDDCKNIRNVLANDGVKVILKEWQNMVHAFPILSPLFPEAKQAFEETCDFIQRNLV